MKMNFKFYALIWAIFLAVWCIVVLLVRPIIPGYGIKYDARFWIAFVFIVLAFIGNLVCAYLALKAENLKKLFLNLPLINASWLALITMLIFGSGLMLIPDYPAWIAAIVCIVVLAFNAVAVIKAGWTADTVSKVDEKLKGQTGFIKNLTIDVEGLLASAKNDAVKAECKKVYEVVRYSDPMSNETLSVIEAKITLKVDEFSSAINADEVEKAKEIADEIVCLVGERNKKCKVLK